MKPTTKQARRLFHDGTLTLSRMESNGMKVDVPYIENAIKETDNQIAEIQKRLKSSREWREWKKRFGDRAKIGSDQQLGVMLFDVLKIPGGQLTEGGKQYKVDAEALMPIDSDFVRDHIQMGKLSKANETFLKGIYREVEPDGYLHANFNLYRARTFRSSGSDPNLQNLPIRDPVMGSLIRRCFIPRKRNRCIVEIDYSGIEVRVAACYHQDPTMLTYIKDKTKDMHRDMAAQCYLAKPDQVSKNMRYCGKNQFVFPQFYGDFFMNNARFLWDSITKMQLTLNDGTPLKEHLARKGIKKRGNGNPDRVEPGTFEAHIKEVEKDFWQKRFPVYTKWKKSWYQQYLKRGWFQMYTGFTCAGLFQRNQVINYPVQGAAFHCLLWSLIAVEREIERSGIDALLISQIHDSKISDVRERDVDDYLSVSREIMVNRIVKDMPWLNVPLEVEAEVAPAGEPWNKKQVKEIDV